LNIREKTYELEKLTLSANASFSQNTRGRKLPVEQCPIRTPYQRDRDRIIHCKSYRRLMHKTQVFLSPEGDHYRTRLTHTQEVNQIARTIARALRLNEDLTEAIALGHDLGHTPFGHAGERALNEVCATGFKHNLQSVRVVRYIENDGEGLNLTWEVLNGIACHSSGCRSAATLEGQVVMFADKIAYINHDIDDAIRAGVLSEQDLPFDAKLVLGRTKSQRIATLITSIVENSSGKIQMDSETFKAYNNLRSFMFDAVYTNPVAKGEEYKAVEIVKRLYDYFIHNTDKFTGEYKDICEKYGADRAACDYISGMSDRYAISIFEQLYIPKSWNTL